MGESRPLRRGAILIRLYLPFFLALIALFIFSKSAYSDVSTSELLKACDEKARVVREVDGKVQVVGEELSGYCKGYIEGRLSALKGKVCLEDEKDIYFVVSVLRKYVEDEPQTKELEAGESLSKAVLRAYKCKQ